MRNCKALGAWFGLGSPGPAPDLRPVTEKRRPAFSFAALFARFPRMLPKRREDFRTILWVLIAPGLVAAQYARPDLVPYLAWFSAYFALACGVIAHNHNHCPTFKNRSMNTAFGNWISIFYGYPTFAWIPTHNLNHHKFVNRAGDATITWRYSNKHSFLIAVSYFFVSAYFQSEPINTFIRKAKEKNPKLFRRIVMQYVVFVGAQVSMVALAIALHGPKTGLFVWGCSMGLPAFFSLWTIMLFNYEQHVHTDPFSEYNHSRSWDGRILNFFLFNNGLHYVHHEHPGTHWSEMRRLHDEVADKIHPDLVQKSLFWYWIKQYALAPLIPSLGTKQIGPGPMNPPSAQPVSLATDEVDLGTEGSNAAFVGQAARS